MTSVGPEQPSSGYLDRLAEQTKAAMARATAATQDGEPPAVAGAPEALREQLGAAVTSRAGDLQALSHDLHEHPEVGYEEHRSVRAVAVLLAAAGHDVEVGAFGLPTALRVVAGSGEPRVAILAEYDALPGIGHACGHNVICATAVGAFLALAGNIGELGGAVELIGTPAEEGGGGKEHIARAGGFDGLTAALMLHPFGYDVAEHPFLGRRIVEATYQGVAAHAAAMPFMGRNALDGVVAAYTGIAALRQHLPPSDRIHGVITDGGARPNVVPERAAALFYVRSAQVDTLNDLCHRVQAVFEGAAISTGTGVQANWDPQPAYLPVRHNSALAARYTHHLGGRGRTVLGPGVVPEILAGSTDLGNVSMRLPAIHPMLAIAPESVSLHTEEFARWAGSERADAGIVDGAVGLAFTAADVLTDADLREQVRAEFEAAGGRLEPAPPAS